VEPGEDVHCDRPLGHGRSRVEVVKPADSRTQSPSPRSESRRRRRRRWSSHARAAVRAAPGGRGRPRSPNRSRDARDRKREVPPTPLRTSGVLGRATTTPARRRPRRGSERRSHPARATHTTPARMEPRPSSEPVTIVVRT
jgi:hypothetical protein